YSADGFARAARMLMLEHGFQVVFVGIAGERELVETVQAALGLPSVSLVGQLSLSEFAALLALAPVLVSNNTGPVHVAAAVGTPVVDLYALTNPQHTPWMIPCRVLCHEVPCRNCYKSVCPEGHQHCLALVPPHDVARAAAQLI